MRRPPPRPPRRRAARPAAVVVEEPAAERPPLLLTPDTGDADPGAPDAVGPAVPLVGGEPVPPVRVDRSAVIGEGLKATAAWSLRLIVIGVALFLVFWLLGQIWVGVRP